MIYLIYNLIFIPIARLYIFIGKFFNEKLKDRDLVCNQLLDNYEPISNTYPTYWFHASSMGEFEQAKPVIENIKKTDNKLNIIVSFFSPSGYINQKDYEFADRILYLPLDSKKNVIEFLDKIKPTKAIFVRYEIWLNFLMQLKNRSIESYLICATKPSSKSVDLFLLTKYYINSFNLFTKIFTVNDVSYNYFNKICPANVKHSADTRFDRIIDKVNSSKNSSLIPESFHKDSFVVIAGSSWEPEEKIIIKSIDKLDRKIKFIIVPHEPTEEHILKLISGLSDYLILSKIDTYSETELANSRVLIVDSIGKLLELYAYGDLAFIGGAYGVGVHSVTEAAGYGMPLISGPRMSNSPDAVELKETNILQIVENSSMFVDILNFFFSSPDNLNTSSAKAKDYVCRNEGISKTIANELLDS